MEKSEEQEQKQTRLISALETDMIRDKAGPLSLSLSDSVLLLGFMFQLP